MLRKSGCAVLTLTSPIELFTQFHYRKSIREDADLSELFRDVFLFHWNEKSQHAIVDELAGMSSLSATHPAPGGR